MYDMRPDRVGWTVYQVETDRPVILDDLVLTELEFEAADELVGLLNRTGRRREKRLTTWPLLPRSSTAVTSGPKLAPSATRKAGRFRNPK